MNKIEAIQFLQALAVEYVTTAHEGRKATQMAVMAKVQEACQALGDDQDEGPHDPDRG